MKKLTKEEFEKLPAHLKLRFGYLKEVLKEQQEKEHEETEKHETAQDFLRHGYTQLQKDLDKEQKDALDD